MKIAEAYVELRMDSKKAEQEGRAKVNSLGNELGSTFGRVFGVAAFAGGIAQSIGAASDLNETVSKTKVIFGESAKDITAWADNSARQFGLSKQAALDGAGTFALFGQAAGLAGTDLTGFSQELVQLAADLASFHNTSPEDAITAIGAALRGESEPIRSYGVLLDDATLKQKAMELGIYDGNGALTQQERVLAAQKAILEQTTTAQGDFARTADGVANSQRIAKAEAQNAAASLGQNFLPVYQRAVEVVGLLAKGFGELPAPVQTGIVALAGFLALAGPVGKMIGTAKDLGGAIRTMVTGAGALGPLAAGVGIVAGAFVAAFAVQETHQDKVTEATKRYTEAIQAANQGTKDAIAQQIQADISQGNFLATAEKLGLKVTDLARVITGEGSPAFDAVRSKLEDLLDPMLSTDIQLKRLRDEFGLGVGPAQAFLDRIDVLAEGMEGGRAAAAAAALITEELTGVNTDAGRAADETATKFTSMAGEAARLGHEAAPAAQAIHGIGEAARDSKTEVDEFAEGSAAAAEVHKEAVDQVIDSIGKEVSAFDELAQAASDLKSAIDEVFGASVSMEEADRAARAAKDELTQAVKDNGTSLDANTEKGRANRSQIQANVQSILDYGVAVVGAGGSTDEAAASVAFMTAELKNQLTQAGFTKEEVDAYITTLGLTPENVNTAITLAGNEAAKRELEARQEQLLGLDAGAVAEIQALVDQGKYQEALDKLNELEEPRQTSVFVNYVDRGVGYEKRASGGPVRAGVPYVVGDGGRPEVFVPRQDGDIVPSVDQYRSKLEVVTSRAGDAGGMATMVGAGRAPVSVNFHGGINNTVDLDAAWRVVNFHLAGI